MKSNRIFNKNLHQWFSIHKKIFYLYIISFFLWLVYANSTDSKLFGVLLNMILIILWLAASNARFYDYLQGENKNTQYNFSSLIGEIILLLGRLTPMYLIIFPEKMRVIDYIYSIQLSVYFTADVFVATVINILLYKNTRGLNENTS